MQDQAEIVREAHFFGLDAMAEGMQMSSMERWLGDEVRISGLGFGVWGLGFRVQGLWFMAYGLCFMLYGQWFMGYGLWLMVDGVWYSNECVGCHASLKPTIPKP